MTWEGIFKKMSSNSQSLTFDAKLLREGRAVGCFFFFLGNFSITCLHPALLKSSFGPFFVILAKENIIISLFEQTPNAIKLRCITHTAVFPKETFRV